MLGFLMMADLVRYLREREKMVVTMKALMGESREQMRMENKHSNKVLQEPH